jgi:2-dehydropantoate 2-reductase
MKFAVVGAGAIGGYLGARLALAGHDVTFIARGANLDAIKAHGFKLIAEDGTSEVARSARAAAIQDAERCDAVLLAVKAQQVAGLAADLRRLFASDTMSATLQNGVPCCFSIDSAELLKARSSKRSIPAARLPAISTMTASSAPSSTRPAPW